MDLGSNILRRTHEGTTWSQERWYTIWMFPKVVVPQIIHFNRLFHYFHHPFWGVFPPIFGNIHIHPFRSHCSMQITASPYDWTCQWIFSYKGEEFASPTDHWVISTSNTCANCSPRFPHLCANWWIWRNAHTECPLALVSTCMIDCTRWCCCSENAVFREVLKEISKFPYSTLYNVGKEHPVIQIVLV